MKKIKNIFRKISSILSSQKTTEDQTSAEIFGQYLTTVFVDQLA